MNNRGVLILELSKVKTVNHTDTPLPSISNAPRFNKESKTQYCTCLTQGSVVVRGIT